MKNILLLALIVACSRPSPDRAQATTQIPEPIAMPMCLTPGGESITVFTDAYNGCHSPNGGLEHGKLCFSGEEWACDRMHNFIRSDSLIKDPINAGADHGGSGSRDELVGHLLYLSRTHNRIHAERLLSVIRHNNNRVCTDDKDGRCTVTPAMFGLMRVVWNHIGLKPTPNMIAGNIGDDIALRVEALSAPVGYQLNLVALQLMIRAHTKTWTKNLSDAQVALRKRMPNLQMRWLAGEDVAAELSRAIETQKEAPQPLVARHWPWSRLSLSPEDHPGAYVFLRNLILKK